MDTLPKTLLGRSKGRWEGTTLVVTTTRIDWRYLDPSGVPLGPSATIVERFTPTPDGTRLSYSMTVTDPATFTQPVELHVVVGVAARRDGQAVQLRGAAGRGR